MASAPGPTRGAPGFTGIGGGSTKLTLVVDDRRVELDVDESASTVTIDGRIFPYRVVSEGPTKVELEVGGETVSVDGWPEGFRSPSADVAVNGERHRVVVEALAALERPLASPTPTTASTAPPPSPSTGRGDGIAIAPPMPGKVVEVRVRAGERVAKGQVLLVLEAMKMRNEVVSPEDALVAEVLVTTGANVRARETMVRLRPAPS